MNNTHRNDADMKGKNVTMVMFPKHDFRTIQKVLMNRPDFSLYATNKKEGAHIENTFCTAGPIMPDIFPQCYTGLCFAVFLAKPHSCDFDHNKFVKDLDIDDVVVINKSVDGEKCVIYYNDQINGFSGTDYFTPSHTPPSQFNDAARVLLGAKTIIDGELDLYERGECKIINKSNL